MAEINIPLFEVEDMKTGRGGGKRGTGQKYAKYGQAVEGSVEYLNKNIAASKDGHIRVRVEDIAKQIGMPGKHETSIYWGLKFVLFQKGIVVTTGQTKGGDPVLVMRARKDGDVLPASLAKHLGTAGVDVEEEEDETAAEGATGGEETGGEDETPEVGTGADNTETQ